MKTIGADLFTDAFVTFPELSVRVIYSTVCEHIFIHVQKAVDFFSVSVSWLHWFEGSAQLKTPHIRVKCPQWFSVQPKRVC